MGYCGGSNTSKNNFQKDPEKMNTKSQLKILNAATHNHKREIKRREG